MKARKKNHQIFKPDPSKRGKRISGKTGLPPGSLVHIGKVLTDSVSVNLTEYNSKEIFQRKIETLDSLDVTNSLNSWIEICGLHETKIIESFGNRLGINPLILEDILNTEHRPKFDMQDDLLFLTLKAFYIDTNKEIKNEQVSFVLGKGFLVSFQESKHPWFEPVRSRLVDSTGNIRQHGLDFILYSLIDVIIDQYYEVVESIGDHLEELEDMIFDNPSQVLIYQNRMIKKDINSIKKALLPALEAINKLNRNKPELIGKDVIIYYNDIDDHILQILDYVDTHRELSAELKENYLSNLTLRMNQVMKLLTIITTIFIPLTFIAGVYGMNFQNMPELTWKYGYFAVLALMFIIIAGMLFYFRKKKWI
ncbi:MAG: magnesium/cobalt transporter CorA [Bacteroidales bacterium]|nr:magnesium/cobalt transporter CorA [Bacteroidales bacterium]